MVLVGMALRDAIGSWAYLHIPVSIRWFGIAGLAASVGWLGWMFVSPGHNLTDTVVTRRAAVLVEVYDGLTILLVERSDAVLRLGSRRSPPPRIAEPVSGTRC